MKGYRRYIAIVFVLFSALVLLDYFRPKPVDWNKSFSNKDKIPYGTFALFELLPGIFNEEPVIIVREPVFNYLQDSTLTGNYIFINQSFQADSLDTNRLLDFVHRGNQVFIAAEGFTGPLADTLHFATSMLSSAKPDSTALVFENPAWPETHTYPANNNTRFLVPDDSARFVPLGRNKAGKLNFIQVPFGEGYFYINTVPLAFTNYAILTLDESAYAAKALSYLPVAPVYWDEYQKQGLPGEQSVFRVLFQHEPLTWAYYLALFTITLFLLFQSKRTQRVIPVLEPPRNTTLDFVKVVASLYYNDGNHKNIAEKKIAYFLEHLHTHYYLPTGKWNEELRELITAKSGADEELVNQLFQLISSIRQSSSIGKVTLMQLSKSLDKFYKQTIRRPLAQK